MNSERFHAWFKNLLPLLPPNSVIVLDNASYHSVVANRVPTMSDRRDCITSWLEQNGIPYPAEMCKAQLMQIVKAHEPTAKRYVVDEMAKEKGHTVIRLPPYHCELNPIELIWADVKNFVANNNTTFKMKDVELLIYRAFATITAEKWRKSVEHVIGVEREMAKLDFAIDEVFDNANRILISLGEDSSDEDEDQPNDEDNNAEWVQDSAAIFEQPLEELGEEVDEPLAQPLPHRDDEIAGFLTEAYRVLLD